MTPAESAYDFGSELSASTRVDTEKLSKLLSEVKKACNKVQNAKAEFASIKIDSHVDENLREFFARLDCYGLTETDCEWANEHGLLQVVFDEVMACYDTLMQKRKYTLSDILYVDNTLCQAEKMFNDVIKHLQQDLMI